MEKSAEAFRSIGEVARIVGVAPHVLRYWETQFSLLKPVKRRDGRRYYRPDDVLLAAGLRQVLREEGLTIRGAKKLLAKDRGETVRRQGALMLAAMDDEDAAALAQGAGVAADADTGAAQAQAVTPTAAEAPAPLPDPPPAPAPAPLTAAAPEPGHSPAPGDAMPDDAIPDDDSDAADRAHPPRSRARKKRARPASGPMPLFPDHAGAPARAGDGGAWLARLTSTAQALGALKSAREMPPEARAAAMRLRRAIDSIY